MGSARASACSALSLAAGEPLAGSASRIRYWLLVEQPGRWGHDALADSDLPPDVGRRLKSEGDRFGIRVLLIKRRGRPGPERRRCFAVFTGRRERRLTTFEVEDPAELLELDLPAKVEDRWAGLGEPVAGAISVVCTHGKHDACCAREGLPTARTLAGREDVWEATHVGGDRFAGNIVCFPHGLYFGRVTAAAAPRVIASYDEGRIALEHYRGRSAHPPAVQAAEIHLREATGLDGVDDLILVASELRGRRPRVSFLVPGGETRTVEMEETLLDARLLTCKASHRHRPRGYVLREIS